MQLLCQLRRYSSWLISRMAGAQGAPEMEATRENLATICATVNSGFEYLATQECVEKFTSAARPRQVKKFRGRILFEIPYQEVRQVSQLRSVDNLSVLVGHFTQVDFSQDKEAAVNTICQQIEMGNWKHALDTWQIFTGSEFCLDPLPKSLSKPQSSEAKQSTPDEEEGGGDDGASGDGGGEAGATAPRPTFRVTCTRSGDRHHFNSRDVAPSVGSLINETYGWPVKMKDYDLEVVVNILEDSMLVALSMTKESMHRRNITHFGVTTLRSTIAYCMLRMTQPQPGEVICDPMCGVGAIPLEGLLAWRSCLVMSGDVNEVAVERTKGNIDSLTEKRKSKQIIRPDLANDVFRWDVTNLPLKSASIDIFVTDLPFGKRMGSRRNNWSLYRQCLEEMARVCRPKTSRAVVLTQDKKCMAQTLQRCGHLWRKKNFVFINHGGLKACVYLLQRAKEKEGKRKHEGDDESGSKAAAVGSDEGDALEDDVEDDQDQGFEGKHDSGQESERTSGQKEAT
ncbi:tRNA (guanine(6)-N(2))-methyltransferase THUMP3-like [Diadema setosum]|uniref:tRNA (guanine(6)-N(2))-methyltransferase THUMP3-like n=1 Tax=Diadema setosum TaxID=31175 RepID=UPI003B3AD25A